MAPLAAGAALALSEEIHGEGHQKGAVVGVSLGLWDSDFHFGSLMGWDAVVVNGGFLLSYGRSLTPTKIGSSMI